MPVSTRPGLDIGIDLFPAPKIEITDTKIGASGKLDRFAKRGEKLLVDIVEDAGHCVEESPEIVAILRETRAF